MKIKIFGIKTVLVNDIPVYVVKVRVSAHRHLILEKHSINYNRIVCKSKDMCEVSLTTTDYIEFTGFSQKLGLALKEIATIDVYNRYSWTNSLVATEDQIKEIDAAINDLN